jgi:KDO2-lipid IV(A) lauroyltransferase
LSALPLRLLYVISSTLFIVSYYLIGYRKKLVRRNLKNAFPEKDAAELKAIEKEFYQNLCDYGVETLKLLTISREDLQQRISFQNVEAVREFTHRGISFLAFASHQFNWEWVLASGSFYLPVPLDFVYQKQSSALFNRFSLLSRTRFGGFAIERPQVAREMVKRKDVLRGIAIVGDQFPGYHNDKKYWTTFLHQRTAFFESINHLVTKTQYPAFYIKVKKVKRGYYECHFIKIGQPPYETDHFHIVDSYVQETEKAIREYPAGWLWSHNRWKHRD